MIVRVLHLSCWNSILPSDSGTFFPNKPSDKPAQTGLPRLLCLVPSLPVSPRTGQVVPAGRLGGPGHSAFTYAALGQGGPGTFSTRRERCTKRGPFRSHTSDAPACTSPTSTDRRESHAQVCTTGPPSREDPDTDLGRGVEFRTLVLCATQSGSKFIVPQYQTIKIMNCTQVY